MRQDLDLKAFKSNKSNNYKSVYIVWLAIVRNQPIFPAS
jgi:hypothetical protein